MQKEANLRSLFISTLFDYGALNGENGSLGWKRSLINSLGEKTSLQWYGGREYREVCQQGTRRKRFQMPRIKRTFDRFQQKAGKLHTMWSSLDYLPRGTESDILWEYKLIA